MIPTTPKGTLIRRRVIPEGRDHSSPLPIGSSREITLQRESAMPFILSLFIISLSSIAFATPFSSAAARSAAFASIIVVSFSISFSAILARSAFFFSSLASAMLRDAALALSQSALTSVIISILVSLFSRVCFLYLTNVEGVVVVLVKLYHIFVKEAVLAQIVLVELSADKQSLCLVYHGHAAKL